VKILGDFGRFSVSVSYLNPNTSAPIWRLSLSPSICDILKRRKMGCITLVSRYLCTNAETGQYTEIQQGNT
jgi:hypothetical protein